MPVTPTPTQHENDQFVIAVAANALEPLVPIVHQPDGSAAQPLVPGNAAPPGPVTWPEGSTRKTG